MSSIHLYIRVSSQRQVDHGQSLQVQLGRLHNYCLNQGWDLNHVKIHRDEGVSGSIPLSKRPAGSLMMEDLMPGDIVVAVKTDRMFRSAIDALETAKWMRANDVDLVLIDLGGSIFSEGSTSHLFFSLLAVFSDWERSRIAERIAEVKSAQKLRHRYLGGGRPLGYQINEEGILEEDPAEAGLIKEIIALKDKGYSIRQIVKDLHTPDIPLNYGSVWRTLKRAEQRRA